MLNHVSLVGRIAKDPELKFSTNNKPFAIITIAVTRGYKNKETNTYETDFLDVTTWGVVATNVVTHCGKGSVVAIRGRIANRIIDLPKEQTIRTMGLIGERVTFIQTKAPETKRNQNQSDTSTPNLSSAQPQNQENTPNTKPLIATPATNQKEQNQDQQNSSINQGDQLITPSPTEGYVNLDAIVDMLTDHPEEDQFIIDTKDATEH